MQISSNDLLVGIPTELTHVLVTQWLNIKDLALTDSAYCNSTQRGAVLAAISSLHAKIPLRFLDRLVDVVHWMYLRDIQVDCLVVFENIGSSYCLYADKFGTDIKLITMQLLDFTASMTCAIQTAHMIRKCIHLNKIFFSDCITSDESLEILCAALASCSSLRELRFLHHRHSADPTEPTIHPMALDNSQHVQLSTLVLDAVPRMVERVLLLCSPAHLQHLEVTLVNDSVADKLLTMFAQCTSLTTLRLTCVEEETLVALLHKCRTIQHLNLTDEEVTDVSAAAIARLPLRSLNVSETDCTDTLLFELAHHTHTLQSLNVTDCFETTGAGLGAVLSQCRQLHTLHMFTHADFIFDMSLLKNITTLHVLCDDELDPTPFLETLSLHCKTLQHFHITAYEFFTLDKLNIQLFPSLQTLHMQSTAPYVDTSAEQERVGELENKLRVQLPNVTINVM